MAVARNFEGAEREVSLLRTCGSTDLRHVASGSAYVRFWLENRKVVSQVVGKDQSLLSFYTASSTSVNHQA